MSSLPKRTAILYQNEACDVTLIDIPTSIAVAQRRPDTLLSTPPLEEPFVIHNEPKNPKAKDKHMYYTGPLHDEYKATIEAALTQLRSQVSPLPWCLPRKLMTQAPDSRNDAMDVSHPEQELDARLREWSASKGNEEPPFDFERMMASLGAASDLPNATSSSTTVSHPWLMSYRPAGLASEGQKESDSVTPEEPQEPWMSSFHNPDDHALDLTIVENQPQSIESTRGAEYRFNIPPRSSLFLSDSTHSDAFRASFRELTEEYVLPRHFDLILLDPPWPSGSAKRKGNYEQTGGMPYMKKLLTSMDVDNYIEHDGLVGIWVTNKQSLREYIVGPGGLFEQWNVGFIEEWIWVKTTVKGEPMFSLDSNWRKPYEILLLGKAAPNSWTMMGPAPEIKRRVIAAVPDVHSRKPCLKELIEPFMPDRKDYSALEIFSRYLVSGWTSWGNEVLKFNWVQYWASQFNVGHASV